MATVHLRGTEFTVSVLPPKMFSSGYQVKTEICIKNEFVNYRYLSKDVFAHELELWIMEAARLLAGAYKEPRILKFERAGIGVDLYPYQKEGEEVSREELRANDCLMSVSLAMRSKKENTYLGGVYAIILHRQEIKSFIYNLRREYEKAYEKVQSKRGKYLFVGLSPLGYEGCCYWYLDLAQKVRPGDYVWAEMGRHNKEQILFVDCVRYCNEDSAPHDPSTVRRVIDVAGEDEVRLALDKLKSEESK
ncbi:MAG: hypothetical protein IJV80_04365 [Clostridia bacterium]|nr:hypothetical protein [Clostridia bacterium]